MSAVFLYVTFPDAQQAEALGRRAIELGHAACLNLFPAHRSIYKWQGQLESTSEHVGLFKTTAAHIDQLEVFIRASHPYATPCLARFNPQVNADFLDWLVNSTSKP
ncbi:MAG TPA: divalent-cation tolerance protein CutA [Pseudobdellovibrionaceae bacterium]|nr:divalent-cation tolerance protein CutA [Pseudobdellovibrionaceae bacterium]